MAGNYEDGESSGSKKDQDSDIPPGFRFCPDDKEIMQYLKNKLNGSLENFSHIPELDIYAFSPMDLAENQKLDEETEMYFFTQRSRKYPNGHRPERFAKDGYWKPTSSGDHITDDNGRKIGFVRTLKFYKGYEKNKSNQATKWLMQEYTPDNLKHKFYEWVAVKIYAKRGASKKTYDDAMEEVEQFMGFGSSESHSQLPDQQFQFENQHHSQLLDQAQSYFLTPKPIQMVKPAFQSVSMECLYDNLGYTSQNPNFGQCASMELGYRNPNPFFSTLKPIEEAQPSTQYASTDCLSHMNENPNMGCSELLDQAQQLYEPAAEAASMESFYNELGQININPSYGDKFTYNFDFDFTDQVNQEQLPGLEEVCTENSAEFSAHQTQLKNEDGGISWMNDMLDMIYEDETDFPDFGGSDLTTLFP